MKRLSHITVQKAFGRIGFIPYIQTNKVTYNLLFRRGACTNQNMSLHLPEQFGNILIEDARWIKNDGVHIVSYYGWPRNLKELQAMIDRIKATYSELCGTIFST